MATYDHLQKLKKAEKLANSDKIGPCITCRFWQVEGARTDALVSLIALCVQPELKKFDLVVSGSSGCNRWQQQPNVGEHAEAYAKRHADE